MEFTGEVIFFTAFATMLISQIAKMVILSFKGRRLSPRAVFELAGMPSSHTASATAATFGVYFAQGFSVLFAIVLLTLLYVMTEVSFDNRHVNRHAKMINEMLPFLRSLGHKPKNHNKLFEKEMREDWGHTPLEIISGFLLGLAITIIVYIL